MKAEDFAAWLSAIFGMNEGQRAEAIAALEKASAVGAEGSFCEEGGQAWPSRGRAGNDQRRARRGSGLSSAARDARSSVGAARTDFRGFAARAVGAPSMR